MKHTVLWVAIAASLLAPAALAQSSSSSNQTASSSSNASNAGANSSTNTSTSTATQNATSGSTAANNNSQNNGSASSLNANITVVTPPPASSSSTDSRLSQDVESSSHTYSYGEHRQYIDYGGSYTIKNVPNVSAPPLISSNDTCMGSASGGVSVAGFGITGGSTYTDEHCKRIKMSRELWNKGMKAASLALDCMDRDAREALELTGFVCPQTARAQRAALEDAAQRHALAVWNAPVGTVPPPLPAEAAGAQPAAMRPVALQADAAARPAGTAAVMGAASPSVAPEPAAAAPAPAPADNGNVVIRRVDSGEVVRRAPAGN